MYRIVIEGPLCKGMQVVELFLDVLGNLRKKNSISYVEEFYVGKCTSSHCSVHARVMSKLSLALQPSYILNYILYIYNLQLCFDFLDIAKNSFHVNTLIFFSL